MTRETNFTKSRSVDFLKLRSLIESEPYSDSDFFMRSQLLEYICNGIEPTHPCLRGILRNDLSQTLGTRPVGESGIQTIEMLLKFLYEHAPGPCFGDSEVYEDWIRQRREAIAREKLATAMELEARLAEIRKTQGARR